MEHALFDGAGGKRAAVNVLVFDRDPSIVEGLAKMYRRGLVKIKRVDSVDQATCAIKRKQANWHCWVFSEKLGGIDLLARYPYFGFCIVLANQRSYTLYERAMRQGAFMVHDHAPESVSDLATKITQAAAIGWLLEGFRSCVLETFCKLRNNHVRVRDWASDVCISVRQLNRQCRDNCAAGAATTLGRYRWLVDNMLLHSPETV